MLLQPTAQSWLVAEGVLVTSSAKIHCGIEKYDPLGTNQLFNYVEQEQRRDGVRSQHLT